MLFLEEKFSLEKFKDILMLFDAYYLKPDWIIEKDSSTIWVSMHYLEDNLDARNAWESVKQQLKIDYLDINTTIFVQPSRAMNSVFLAIEFLKQVYCNAEGNTMLYDEWSGVFWNDEITKIKFIDNYSFYNYSKINTSILSDIISSLYTGLTMDIEYYMDAGWDGDENKYTGTYKNYFLIRNDIDESIRNKIGNTTLIEKTKEVDKLILKLFRMDKSRVLLLAGKENRNEEIRKWWWHLDKVESGELIVNLEEDYVTYQNKKISIKY